MIPTEDSWYLIHGSSAWEQVRFRLGLIQAAWMTALATGWLISLGPLPAVLALLIAKHVLVAILMVGLGGHAPPESGSPTE